MKKKITDSYIFSPKHFLLLMISKEKKALIMFHRTTGMKALFKSRSLISCTVVLNNLPSLPQSQASLGSLTALT